MRHILYPVRPGLEASAVVHPIELDALVTVKILLLPVESLLLAVAAIERINVGKEFLGVRLLHLPRRVANDGIKTWRATLKDIWEFQFPVEKAMGIAQL